MKIFKIFGIIILSLIAIIAVFVTASAVNHNIKLRREAKKYSPPGQMVEVNNKQLHVYAEGEGDVTLVFMAGHGTSNPTLDFKPLWMRMVDEYRIAVVEKSGYGWSESANSPRDIETMLEETRKALEISGENAPYVLFPHSMSGLEAIYWAQEYPDEVKAIIGLDPLIPEMVDLMPEPPKAQLNLMHFISRIGLSRLMPESDIGENLPLMTSNTLSEEDKNQYLAVFYKSAFTKEMLREVDYLSVNAEMATSNQVPANTPMLFFISEGQENKVPGWKETLTNYLDKIAVSEAVHLDTGHYIHYDKPELIAETAKDFLAKIN